MDWNIRQVLAQSMKMNNLDTSMNSELYLSLCDALYHKRLDLDVRMVAPSSMEA